MFILGILRRHLNIVFGFALTAVFLCVSLFGGGVPGRLDLGTYDLMMNLTSSSTGDEHVVLVEIDDKSVESIGPWPWSRALIAQGLKRISVDQPKAVGLDFVFETPEMNAALNELKDLEALFTKTFSEKKGPKEIDFLERVNRAKSRLEGDGKLADAMEEANTVILPVIIENNTSYKNNARKDVTLLQPQHLLENIPKDSLSKVEGDHASFPHAALLNAAEGIGYKTGLHDPDGTNRREKIIYNYKGVYLPSYALALAIRFLGVSRDRIKHSESGLLLADFRIPTGTSSEMLINFKGPPESFKKYSFVDVIKGRIRPGVFKDKIVLINIASPTSAHTVKTPISSKMSQGELTANVLWTITHQQFIEQPRWAPRAEILAIVMIGLLIAFVLPRLGILVSGIVSASFLLILAGGTLWLFNSKGTWITTTYPILQLVFGYMGVLLLNRYQTEPHEEKKTGESSETVRLLAVTFQREGMLDMAFDKLQNIPVDEETKKLLYTVALDYEKKSQFNKAVTVYEYIEEHDNQYRDIQRRKRNLVTSGETVVLGDELAGDSTAGGHPVPSQSGQFKTLGRYEIIKEIGRGAMGRVYLGRDPRINRTTAIKTFRFSDDFELEEIQKMKAMFFREAESAGTLSHANIVTIYDAGEEAELAYIAMEYLDGSNLERFTKTGNLLPIPRTVDYLFRIADALDYAHRKGIVHRDIKPANIMLLKDKTLKITDFGIARIASTSQTQTGVVKGTPFYMSPEQFSGERVDGRSDIFALGVMMFQLLTGNLPFSGKTPIDLMQKIMKEPHPNPKEFNPKVIAPLVKIIDKALEKDRSKRYQRASEMATHLREIGRKIDAAIAKWKASQKKTAPTNR